MFKDIPGNKEFQIALNGKIIDKDNIGRNPIIVDGKILIMMYGCEKWVDVTWLSLIAHFEVDLPDKYKDRVWDITFTDIDPRSSRGLSNKVMVLKKPILIYNEYRIIPCFTKYGINKKGEILNIERDLFISTDHKNYDYPTVRIYNPDRNGLRQILIHRLVALAWCSNVDYILKPIVNHKDGNKKNFYYKNLEWCSYLENNKHAVNTGLRTDNISCKIRDVQTKEIHNFYSIKQACQFMGIRDDIHLKNLAYKTKHRLVADRYEIKLSDDESPWFYEKHVVGTVAGRYTLQVTMSDGSYQEYPDLKTFKSVFKVWNVSSINDVIRKAEHIYPGMKINIVDHYNVTPIQAYRIETGEIIEVGGIRQLSKILDKNFSAIRTALIAGETRVHQGYAFRYKNDKSWDINFAEYKSSSRCVLARHKETNEEMKFESQREAAKHFNIDRSVIRRFLRNGRYFRLWKLSETET